MKMKRPIFLTIWLVVMLLLSLAMTIDSLTYLHFIFLTKSYFSLFGIAAGFVEVWSIIQLLRWKKTGVTLYISSAIVILLATAINELSIVSNVNQMVISLLMVLIVNLIVLGILYLAIRPAWKSFK